MAHKHCIVEVLQHVLRPLSFQRAYLCRLSVPVAESPRRQHCVGHNVLVAQLAVPSELDCEYLLHILGYRATKAAVFGGKPSCLSPKIGLAGLPWSVYITK